MLILIFYVMIQIMLNLKKKQFLLQIFCGINKLKVEAENMETFCLTPAHTMIKVLKVTGIEI